MNSIAFFEEWKMVLIDPDEKKLNKLCLSTELKIHYFRNVPSFVEYVKTISDARQRLILLAPGYLIGDLPCDIMENLYGLYVYAETFEEQTQSFDDVCRYLLNLIIAQCTERSTYFRRLDEHGPARIYAQKAMTLNKILNQQLQDLCDGIDEQLLLGQEEN